MNVERYTATNLKLNANLAGISLPWSEEAQKFYSILVTMSAKLSAHNCKLAIVNLSMQQPAEKSLLREYLMQQAQQWMHYNYIYVMMDWHMYYFTMTVQQDC